MSVHRTILFPFEIQGNFFDGYSWTLELAHRMNARLQLLTTDQGTLEKPVPADSLYQTLLQAQGHYLQYYHHEDRLGAELKPEPIIMKGELKTSLLSYLQDTDIDILVVDASLNADRSELQEIIAQVPSAIILPKAPRVTRNWLRSDRFLELLRRAELHRLPENFFSTLGQDKSVFNYLRRLFQKD